MFPLSALFGVLGLNYVCHRLGLPTICSTCRRFIGPRTMLAIVAGFVGWFIPHYWRPFLAVVEALDDTRPEIEEIP